MKRKILSKQRGITLIALVVTIVVLLILAGVSIAMLAGEDGIIRQAQNAKEETKKAEIKEKVELTIVSAMASGRGNIDTTELQKELEKLDWDGDVTAGLPATGKINGMEVTIYENGNVTVKEGTLSDDDDSIAGKKFDGEEKITIGGKPVTVPGGATISGIEKEYENVDNGIVIYIIPENETVTDWYADEDDDEILDVQEKYDQFVWVPVPHAIAVDKNDDKVVNTTDIDLMIADEEYPMAIATDETNYRGVLYQFFKSKDADGKEYVEVLDKDYVANGSREPSTISEYDTSSYLPQINGILNTSYSNDTSFGSALQTEFNKMVNRVNNNKGFWVGRYETSEMSNSTTTSYTSSNEIKVRVVKGAKTGTNSVTWYRMYAQQQIYSKKAGLSATSSMIWGSQWDQIMIWMKEVKNTVNTANGEYYVTNSVGMGNFGTISGVDDGYATSSPAPTGCFDVKNIYDLAGNLNDWTLEANDTKYRVYCRRIFLGYV